MVSKSDPKGLKRTYLANHYILFRAPLLQLDNLIHTRIMTFLYQGHTGLALPNHMVVATKGATGRAPSMWPMTIQPTQQHAPAMMDALAQHDFSPAL